MIAKKQNAATNQNQIAKAKNFKLAGLAIDLGTVGAFEIRKHQMLIV
jgi:hypothetical protein